MKKIICVAIATMMALNMGISQYTEFHSEYLYPNEVIADDSGMYIDSMQIVLALSSDSTLYLGVGYDGTDKINGLPSRDVTTYIFATAYESMVDGGPTTYVFSKIHNDGNLSTFRLINHGNYCQFVQNSVWGDISYICPALEWDWQLPSFIKMGIYESSNN